MRAGLVGLVTVLFEIEQDFAVRIPLQALDVESLRTIERIAVLVEDLLAAA